MILLIIDSHEGDKILHIFRFLITVSSSMKDFYITTAIDYANGNPHLGHAYEKVLADVVARVQRLKGQNVHFLTGLDEHGQKVQQTAERENIDPQALCDRLAENFRGLCNRLNISNSDYIRTTEPRHKEVVQAILQNLYDKGQIYRKDYHGFYSVRTEQFVQERDQVDGKWPEEFGEVVEITEPNYFFKLSEYQDWLIEYLEKNPEIIQPTFRRKQVLEFLKEPLNDLCISRPKKRLAWGIPLPFDPEYVTYVWFDALTNYISAVGYGTDDFEKRWPADVHVIGKDILVPPHAVYWPIMLKAIGVEMPKSYLVHGWWKVRGAKMSKSTGNVVDPLELIEQYGADVFRYYVMREMIVGQDSDFTVEQYLKRYTDDLGNDLGNLVSRLLNMGHRYCEGKVPKASINEEPEQILKDLWEDCSACCLKAYSQYEYPQALDHLFRFIRGINRYAETRAPWKLAKSEDVEDRKKLETSLFFMAESLRLACNLLTPVMPKISERILRLLSQAVPKSWDNSLIWSEALEGAMLGEKTILFPRPEPANAS